MKKQKQIERLLKEAIKDAKESTTTRFGNGVRCVAYGDYAVCVGWLRGYGDEKRTDCIQYEENPDWALNIGIKIYDLHDMCEYECLTAPMHGDVILCHDETIDPRWNEKVIDHMAFQSAEIVKRLADAYRFDKKTGRLEKI